ncbi:MAG: phosphoenolpyruvate synthase [Gammaproteobacteria bacterium]|nr:phosphoenolpyruvate synthase [Gammaproteobacteria bacterium]
MENTIRHVIKLHQLGMKDIGLVGGKNASLGEMIQNLAKLSVKVPPGFATSTAAYQEFLDKNQISNQIYTKLKDLDPHDLKNLKKTSGEIRKLILSSKFSPEFIAAVTKEYNLLAKKKSLSFAVRSSATAEDLPEASFAGQHDSFLNVSGIKNILRAIKKVYASLFNQRAIIYRIQNNFPHDKVLASAGIQVMVRSDCGSSGVMFTLDTETGFDKIVFINASWGLGESIVQGIVNPDEFYVYKPSIALNKPAILQRNLGSKASKIIYGKGSKITKSIKTTAPEQKKFCIDDLTVTKLARFAATIENHYKKPMDIEWAQDGKTKEIYIVQSRPETVRSQEQHQIIERFHLKKTGQIITKGHSIGQKIGQGKACIITNPKQMRLMQPGQVLVADMTDPDWEPIMKIAKAIVTNRGGRTCHAAIVARELGIPAVVGCNDATTKIKQHEPITVSCASGDLGLIYRGILPVKVEHIKVAKLSKLPVKLCMNLADPSKAFSYQCLPNDGVGLVRIEFIINSNIGIHPKALLQLKNLAPKLRQQIKTRTAAYPNPVEFYIEKLREGIATISAAFFPKPVIVRFSDFKSNEYANLLGGSDFEPQEENPMIGFRGGSRYLSKEFADCFALECEAIKRILAMGLTNTQVMLPFVRTVEEAKHLIKLLEKNGLKRGKNGLKVILMCEIPSNALLAEDFLKICDGFSIGSNDLTQLTLGLDRDSSLVAHLFDERNEAVKKLIHHVIKVCRKQNKYIGICGQAPSDYPDFAKWLLNEKIDAISLTPDSIIETWLYLAKNV